MIDRSSVTAAGVMPSMACALAMVAGRMATSFWRSSADRPGISCVVDPVRDLAGLVAPNGLDVVALAVEVDRVLRVDVELIEDRRGQGADLGPDARDAGPSTPGYDRS